MRDEFATVLKDAMKAKDTRRISTIRLIQTAIKDRDIANRGTARIPSTMTRSCRSLPR